MSEELQELLADDHSWLNADDARMDRQDRIAWIQELRPHAYYVLTLPDATEELVQAYRKDDWIYIRFRSVRSLSPEQLASVVIIYRVQMSRKARAHLPIRWRKQFEQFKSYYYGKVWDDQHAEEFLSKYDLTLPHHARPTLSQYDNRRTQFVDRYRFGIYRNSDL